MTHVAFADRAGVIRFGRRCPKGALPIGRHRHFVTLHDTVSVVARLAYDNETLLVPGARPKPSPTTPPSRPSSPSSRP